MWGFGFKVQGLVWFRVLGKLEAGLDNIFRESSESYLTSPNTCGKRAWDSDRGSFGTSHACFEQVNVPATVCITTTAWNMEASTRSHTWMLENVSSTQHSEPDN